MTDRLDAIAAGLRDGRYDCRVPEDTDDVRWLVGEVRRLRETQFCAYCGWSKESSSWDDLRRHVETCEAHPLVAVIRERDAARDEAARLRGLVDEVRACGTEDDDPRLRYMIVQIDKGLWGDLKAALDTPAREGGEK